jgi:hypothetical protein
VNCHALEGLLTQLNPIHRNFSLFISITGGRYDVEASLPLSIEDKRNIAIAAALNVSSGYGPAELEIIVHADGAITLNENDLVYKVGGSIKVLIDWALRLHGRLIAANSAVEAFLEERSCGEIKRVALDFMGIVRSGGTLPDDHEAINFLFASFCETRQVFLDRQRQADVFQKLSSFFSSSSPVHSEISACRVMLSRVGLKSAEAVDFQLNLVDFDLDALYFLDYFMAQLAPRVWTMIFADIHRRISQQASALIRTSAEYANDAIRLANEDVDMSLATAAAEIETLIAREAETLELNIEEAIRRLRQRHEDRVLALRTRNAAEGSRYRERLKFQASDCKVMMEALVVQVGFLSVLVENMRAQGIPVALPVGFEDLKRSRVEPIVVGSAIVAREAAGDEQTNADAPSL